MLLYESAPFFTGVFVPLSSVTNRLVSMGKGIVTILHGRVVRLVVSYLNEGDQRESLKEFTDDQAFSPSYERFLT